MCKSRKERRAEKFGHSSPSRVKYKVPQCYYGIQQEITYALVEMHLDVRDSRIDAYMDKKDSKTLPHCQYRDECFFLTM